MAVNTFTFEGKLKYAFVINRSPTYENYSVRFYPKDAETRRAIKATGVRNNTKEDDDGFYYQFRNTEKPMVVFEDGTEVTDLVGDGTEAVIQLSVEDFVSAKFGKVVRSKLTGVIVKKLVKYEPKADPSVTPAVPV